MKTFEKYTTEEFNNVFGTELKATDTFYEASENIEKEEVSYFYISGCSEDIEEAIENEKDIAEMLDLRLIEIIELGVFIATY
jgi:hypothetical protein